MTFVVDSADARELPTRCAFLFANAHEFPARRLIVLSGPTGAGKTAVLRALAARGAQVVDLEALACHRGSTFGSLGQPVQPSHAEFQARVVTAWHAARPGLPLFIEDEGEYLGSVGLPPALVDLMRCADRILLDPPQEVRIARLVREYADCSAPLLAAAIRRAAPRLGQERVRVSLAALTRENRGSAVRALLAYYDQAYSHRLASADRVRIHMIDRGENTSAAVGRIAEFFAQLIPN